MLKINLCVPLTHVKIIFIGLLFLHPAHAKTEASNRWVHGSWVNVREARTTHSPVLTQLVINTPVKLLSHTDGDKFCEITWGKKQSGFIACSLLGDRPLTIKEVGDYNLPNGATNPQYSPTRAFWIEPSFTRLQTAGSYFWRIMLPPAQRERETIDDGRAKFDWENRPRLQRFFIPEFDAMKALLRNGIVAPNGDRDNGYPQPVPWRKIQEFVRQGSRSEDVQNQLNALHNGLGDHSGFTTALRQIELPSIVPSYFKNISEIGRPSAKTEGISTLFKIPFAINILNGASWANGHYNGIYLFGAWDMGEVDLELTTTIYNNRISNLGHLTSMSDSVNSSYKIDHEDSADCFEGFQYGERAEPSADNILKKKDTDFPLFFFYTKHSIDFEKVKMRRTAWTNLDTSEQKKEQAQASQIFTQAQSIYIDINSDGIFDLAIWQGKRIPSALETPKPELNFRFIFSNIAGQWHLFEVDDYVYMCGC